MSVTVVMRAREGEAGVILATNDIIRPMKSVGTSPTLTFPQLSVPNGNSRTYYFTIRLERLSPDTPAELDVVYDILPGADMSGLTYVAGSSKLRVDGGAWESFGDPSSVGPAGGYGNFKRLRWPASGNFTSPMRDFEVRQVKEIQFAMTGPLSNNANYVNWVVLDPWDTLSGPQARITVGNPSNPNVWGTWGGFEIGKVAEPDIVQPGVETDIKYTLTITNHNGSTEQLQAITDYLPPGFFYLDNSTSGNITTSNPQGWPNLPIETINGLERQVLRWTSAEIPPGNKSFAAGEAKTLVFWVRTTKDVSGSYYNEFEARPDLSIDKILYEIIGPTTANDPGDREMWNTAYSWNTGTVLVPYYDSRADAGEVIIDANLGLVEGGIAFNSWQVY